MYVFVTDDLEPKVSISGKLLTQAENSGKAGEILRIHFYEIQCIFCRYVLQMSATEKKTI